MNLYGFNHTLLDLGYSDASLIESISNSYMIADRRFTEREEENLLKLSNSVLKNIKRNDSPPKHRHDGTSPLPLGMDWSPPPRNWDGPNTVWPHDFHTGWSYCVTVLSWNIYAESGGSEPVVFYRVQIGLQSPEGVTITQEVLRRFSDFLKLHSDLKRSFRNKKLPPGPPKGLMRMKNRTLLEERRCSLEAWMEKVLSDIDISRSAPVACFLELEAAARLSFRESNHHLPNVNLSSNSSSSSDPVSNDVSVVAGTSALASSYYSGSTYEASCIQLDLYAKDDYTKFDKGTPISDNDFVGLIEATVNEAFSQNNSSTLSKEISEGKEENFLSKSSNGRINLDQIQKGLLYTHAHHHDSVEYSTDLKNSPKGTSPDTPSKILNSCEVHQDSGTSSKGLESVETSEALDTHAISDLQLSPDTQVVFPLDEQQKMNRLVSTVQQRLVTSKTDIEDLMARLNQELALRQYLTTKVKDLETELESKKQIGNENLEQAISVERERFTQMQWDVEELRRKCVEMESRFKAEQNERAHAEATKTSIIEENEALQQELESAREQLKNLQKCHEEADLKSKSDVKLLVKEIKSVRRSQSELQQELDRVSKEKMDFETKLDKERAKMESVDAANRKLLRECEILRGRLEECSVNFLDEQDNKLKMEFLPDALDILATSENRIGLLLAEAQLLAQDESGDLMTTDDELRKMLADVLIDNAILRKRENSVLQCALNAYESSSVSQ
ncbi:hypothetical protein ACS0TY_034221 [Phlomoides rotata]